MKRIGAVLEKTLNALMAFCLAFMSILVFGNVVLRYGFNSGITWSEEMSRFLFIWMSFLGAIGALKDNDHLGVDTLVRKLPTGAKRIVFVISNAIVLYVLYLLFDGSWKITLSSVGSRAPATGLPMAFIYGTGLVVSIGMGLIILFHLYQALFRTGAIDELTRMKESEEAIMAAAPVQHEATELALGRKQGAAGGER
ncbi:TRAP transporter small permease subunit [Geobacillus thermoleovorans]|uniref:C4-dicarboxylate ABC transporter permease n=3 Tax=Geobacillus TaxID=129337 RepID=A0A7U9JCT4_GEOTM|nr:MULTISPECIES: TRAP transporter small permease [Geobacillus]AMV11190.1 C4-dicarboxylate ABC transporter permease [Geobacillus thermoleovorans]ESU73099.1 C4-dicarboxylate ABC transporter permease [Geobacillus sp. MAS1]UPT59704.1 TRAP transporter small permease subunit [Geobacillus thermoleovorans]WMJ18706.1 TRAP transporter small permease [Geobacillus kaustophilus]